MKREEIQKIVDELPEGFNYYCLAHEHYLNSHINHIPDTAIRVSGLMEYLSTETPEEKEALDAIEQVEWDGEGLPPVGAFVIGRFKKESDTDGLWRIDYISEKVGVYTEVSTGNQYTFASDSVSFTKPESLKAKKEREELEAAYDLYYYAKTESVYSCVIVGFKEFISDFPANEREEYLAIVRKTGYRKGE